jgi:hypothetical protein
MFPDYSLNFPFLIFKSQTGGVGAYYRMCGEPLPNNVEDLNEILIDQLDPYPDRSDGNVHPELTSRKVWQQAAGMFHVTRASGFLTVCHNDATRAGGFSHSLRYVNATHPGGFSHCALH